MVTKRTVQPVWGIPPSFQVLPDPKTTVTGQVVDVNNQAVANATVTVFNQFSAQTGADGRFNLTNVPTVRGDIAARATATISGITSSNTSVPKVPVAGGVTALGTFRLATGPTAPTIARLNNYEGNGTSDLLVTYPLIARAGKTRFRSRHNAVSRPATKRRADERNAL